MTTEAQVMTLDAQETADMAVDNETDFTTQDGVICAPGEDLAEDQLPVDEEFEYEIVDEKPADQQPLFTRTTLELRILDAELTVQALDDVVIAKLNALGKAQDNLSNARADSARGRRILEYLMLQQKIEVAVGSAEEIYGGSCVDAYTGDLILSDDDVALFAPPNEVEEPDDDEPKKPIVHVLWPGANGPVESDIGPFTRYGELIADGLQDGESIEDFEAMGPVDESNEGNLLFICDKTAIIPRNQWGATFHVVKATEPF